MSITNNILYKCKNGLGGLDVFYIFPYVKYSRTQIVLSGQTLTSYPETSIFKVYSDTANYTETSSFEGGAEKWEQNFTFDIPKTEVGSELYKLLRQNVMIIYTDRLGNNRILGLYNGLECVITNESGADKESFNGYRVTSSGLEDNQAYFIDDIEDIGLVIGANFIYEDGENYIFNDDTNYLLG